MTSSLSYTATATATATSTHKTSSGVVVRAALPASSGGGVNNKKSAVVVRFLEKTAGRASMAGLTLQPVLSSAGLDAVDTGLVIAATSAMIAYGTYKTSDIEVWPPRKPFTGGVETLNGRVAMLGVIAYMLHYSLKV